MNDLTRGNEYRTLLFFGMPILIGNLFQQLYNVVDGVVVGRFLGAENLAAVGFGFLIGFLLTSLSMGLTLGSGILVSRCCGAGKPEKIGTIVDTGIWFSVLLGIAVTAAGVEFSPGIVRMFNVPAESAGFAACYLRILFAGCLPLFLYNTLTNLLRGLGDSKGPVFLLTGGVLLNAGLDLLCIAHWKTGIAGAAYATVVSQIAVCAGTFLYLRFRYPAIGVRFRLDFGILRESLRIGIPAMTQQLFLCVGFMAIQGMVDRFGSDCMASFAITSKIDAFAQLPVLNLGQALSNFIAQNLAANRPDRVERGVRAAMALAVATALAVSLLVLPVPELILRLFIRDGAVLAIGCGYLRIVGIFYCVNAVMQILNGFLLGCGRAFVPMISTVGSLCLLQVPVAWLLSSTFLGCTGIWLATPCGWIGGVLIRWFYCRKTRLAFQRPDPAAAHGVTGFPV